MGDRLGIPRVVDSFLFVLKIIFWSVIFNFSILSKKLLKLCPQKWYITKFEHSSYFVMQQTEMAL